MIYIFLKISIYTIANLGHNKDIANTKAKIILKIRLLNPYEYKEVVQYYISCESRNCFYGVPKLISCGRA